MTQLLTLCKAIVLIFITSLISVSLSVQIGEVCPTGYFYDSTILDCNQCPTGMIVSSDGKSCTCSAKSFISSTTSPVTNLTVTTCASCPQGSASSLDRSRCIPCPGVISNSTGECFCEEGYALKEKDINGAYLDTKRCELCANGTYPGGQEIVHECVSCPTGKVYDTTSKPWTCKCDTKNYVTAGTICVPNTDAQFIVVNYPISSAKSLSYNNEETLDSQAEGTISIQTSDTIEQLYLKSAYECIKNINGMSCQVLANLCVIALFNQDNQICKLYNYIAQQKSAVSDEFPGWKQGLPWLYYSATADKVINNTERIKFEVSFDPNDSINVNKLEFYIAKYDIFGNFYGLSLLGSELQLCSSAYEDGFMFRSFGTTIENNCNIDLSVYLSRNYTMYFYELFLLDPTTNKLIDIPIMIDNIPNPKASGVTNNMNNATNPTDWILTRRFFLFDNLGAIQESGSFYGGKTAFALRFPKLIKLKVFLQNIQDKARIMVPYVEIMYKSRRKDYIESVPKAYIQFNSEYNMSTTNFYNAAQGIFITLNILVGIVVVVRMYIWYKLNPPMLSPDNYCFWFLWIGLFKLFKYWGLFMFWFIWGISAYWYIFFKLQYRVFVLLPPITTYMENYKSFDVIFGIGCFAYSLYLFFRIGQQTNFDIFFVDWEHDKEILVKNAEVLRTQKYRGAWRVLHVANQFNELQKKRTISFPFCICWLVFMWWYIKWSDNPTAVPNTESSPKSPDNYILRHFLSSFVLIICGLTQYLLIKLLQLWIPLKKMEFMDLCCVSNISIFILDQSLHGYYIHGQSPAGKADTNLDELLRFLEEEGTGKVRGRGLTEKDADSNLQCYEVYISYTMRTIYDGLYLLQTESMMMAAQNRDKLANQSRIVGFLRHLPRSLQIDKIYQMNTYMNYQLKNKIENVASQSSTFIKNKTCCERFLDFPPPVDLAGDKANEMMLYKDPNMNFDECLISGIEWDWFIWDVYTFQMWMLSLNSLPIAIFLTFICDQILYKCRVFYGEKNIARKAVIDNKFFS